MSRGCSNWGSLPKEAPQKERKLFRQFLGTKPGIVVELLDDSASPYRLRTAEGFEFFVGADEFSSYYKPEGDKTPPKWAPFVTVQSEGLAEAEKMQQVMDFIHQIQDRIRDFDKAREFSRDLVRAVEEHPTDYVAVTGRMAELGWAEDLVDKDLAANVKELPADIRELLKDDRCAVVHFLDISIGGNDPAEAWDAAQKESPAEGSGSDATKKVAPVRKVKMRTWRWTWMGT